MNSEQLDKTNICGNCTEVAHIIETYDKALKKQRKDLEAMKRLIDEDIADIPRLQHPYVDKLERLTIQSYKSVQETITYMSEGQRHTTIQRLLKASLASTDDGYTR